MRLPRNLDSSNPLAAFRYRGDEMAEDLTVPPPPKALVSTVFHLTGFSGAKAILTSGALWARDLRTMSDHRELDHGADLYRRVIRRAMSGASGLRKEFLCNTLRLCEPHGRDEPYEAFVASFTDTLDSQRIWKEHGLDGAGFALAFDTRKLMELRPVAMTAWIPGPWPVIYNEEPQQAAVLDALERAWKLVNEFATSHEQYAFSFAQRGAEHLRDFFGRKQYLYKRPDLAWEQEYRLSLFRVRDHEYEQRDVQTASDGRRYIVMTAPPEARHLVPNGIPITEVVAGPTTPQAQLEEVAQIARTYNAPTRRMPPLRVIA